MIRLLIADDERLEREALAEMVTRRFVEHEVVLEEAENGRKAADTAILWGADLILMDIEMPGMNGLDAARAVLAQRPGCRVIFVTAYSLFQYAHEAVHLGACDYLLKPVDPDELEASIRRAIRQIETERKLEALAPIQQEQEPEAPAAPQEPVRTETRDIFEIFLDSVCLDDDLLTYLIDILKRHAEPEFTKLSHAAARTELKLDDFLAWLGNMELLAGLLTLLLLAYLAWCLWAHRRPHWLAWAQLGLCAANIVYALTCPGTALRYGNEVTSWFQDYGMRSLWQNFELGISAAMSRMVLEPHLLFFVFCVLLACAVWARYRQPLYRLFSLFPVSAALVLGVLGGPLRALAPRLSFFADAVTEKGTLTPLNAWTLKRWLPFLLLCAVLFACALELYLALGHGAAAYAGVAVYLSGFASYGAMGFSPSIWASGARSGFFFAFALAAAGALVLRALPEKRMPWRVFGCTAAVCALAQCLSLLGA